MTTATAEEIIDRTSIFAAQRAVNVAMLAAEAIANHAAQGQDVEGEAADLQMHLRDVVAQLDVAVG